MIILDSTIILGDMASKVDRTHTNNSIVRLQHWIRMCVRVAESELLFEHFITPYFAEYQPQAQSHVPQP